MNFEDRKRQLGMAPSSRGKNNLWKHLNGERLTQRQAILAKCCDCMGYHGDGRIDCHMPHCSLYPWMAYRDREGKPKQVRKSRRQQPAIRSTDGTPEKRGRTRKVV